MPRRKGSKDEIDPALILIILFVICIAGFFMGLNSGNWVLVLGSVFIGIFPFYGLMKIVERETGVQIIEPIVRKLFGEKRRVTATEEYTSETVSLTAFDEVTNILENWTPSKRFKDESHAEVATLEYLKHYFPRTKHQKAHGEVKADVEIGNIGIEIKVSKKSRHLTTLRGQLIQYCKCFDYVIALIFDSHNVSSEALRSFEEDMKELYGDKLQIITK